MAVTAFSTHVPTRIELTKRIAISLYRVAGVDDAVIRDFCRTPGMLHYGIVFVNYENYEMRKSFPLLFNVTIDHSEDEMRYVDGQALTDTIIEQLEKELTANGYDTTVVVEFKVLQSTVLRNSPIPVEVPAPRASAPVFESRQLNVGTEPEPVLNLDDGTVIYISATNGRRVSPVDADGFFTMLTKVTPGVPGVKTMAYFDADRSKVTKVGDNLLEPALDPDDLMTKMKEYIAKHWLDGTVVQSLHLRMYEDGATSFIQQGKCVDAGTVLGTHKVEETKDIG